MSVSNPINIVGPHSSSTLLFDDDFIPLGGVTLADGLNISTTPPFIVTSDGVVCFEIGNPKVDQNGVFPDIGNTQFTSDDYNVGISVTPGTQMVNAFQLIDRWLDVYLLDTPPAPTLRSKIADSQKIQILWNNIPQVEAGIVDVRLPKIDEMRVDYVKTELNTDRSFSDPSLVTVNTGITSIITVDGIELYVDGINSGINGSTWEEYTIETGVSYDFRIYGINDNDVRPLKYLKIFDCVTLSVDVPNQPTDFSGVVQSYPLSQFNLSWTKPTDHDIGEIGLQILPFIKRYSIDYIGVTSIRFGGVCTDIGITQEVDGAIAAAGFNANTTLNVSADLYPGTEYDLRIAAQNTLNSVGGPDIDGYGEKSTVLTLTTDLPTQPPQVSTSDANALHHELRTPYQTESAGGGFSLNGNGHPDGNTAFYIIRFSNINDTSIPIRTTSTPTTDATRRRNNEIAGDTSVVTGTLTAYGGLYSNFLSDPSSEISKTIGGFGQLGITGNDDIKIGLRVNNDGDRYTSCESGFWKTFEMYGQGLDSATNYPASVNPYALQLKYEGVGTSSISTARVDFAVDDIETNPIIKNIGFIDETTNGNVVSIGGVSTYTQNATFGFRFSVEQLTHYFLRFDKLHATVVVETSLGADMSAILTIKQTDIGGSHEYFDAPTISYTLSENLHNINGLVLGATGNPNDIQFNDFDISLSSLSNNICDEAFVISIYGSNLFEDVGSTVSSGWLSITDGSTLDMRIDTKSINIDRSPPSGATSPINSQTLLDQLDCNDLYPDQLGARVRSGIDPLQIDIPSPNPGNFPILGSGENDFSDPYDNNENIVNVGITGYGQELQLSNGKYQGPGGISDPLLREAFRNYLPDVYFFPDGSNQPDYSSVSSDNGWRYVTFKYNKTGLAITYERVLLCIRGNIGLTVDLSGFNNANHRLHLKVDGGGASDEDDWRTGWLDCTNPISALGLPEETVPVDDTRCLDSGFSNNDIRACFIKAGTTQDATYYVRLGIRNNIAASCTGIGLEIVEFFPDLP